MAAHAVAGDHKMSYEQLGAFTARVDEIKRQIDKGTLSYALTMLDLQKIVDHKPRMAAEPWKKAVPMGELHVSDCIEKLRKAHYFIHPETEHKLILFGMNHQFVKPDTLADFWKYTPLELGLEPPFSYTRILERLREVVPYKTDFGPPQPTLETALKLALEVDPMEFRFHSKLVIATKPLESSSGLDEYLLVIRGDGVRTHILLRTLKEIGHDLSHPSANEAVFPFAVMGTPYRKKK